MLEDRDQGVRMPVAHEVEINPRDQFRHQICAPVPSEHVTFELRQSHRAKPQAPEVARWVEEIEMGPQYRRSNTARHPVPCFEQGPVERFAIERDQHRTFRQALGQRRKHRTFFAVLTHEQLLDLEAAAFPPSQADQKRIRSCSAHQSRCFRV